MEYNINQYPEFDIKMQPMNQVVNSNTERYHSCNGAPDSSSTFLRNISSNIHINPLMCGSRNIYVNKALYYNKTTTDSNQTNIVENKSERVYYNPKFFRNPTSVLKNQPSTSTSCKIPEDMFLPRKQETNIYVNPHFIKNEKPITATPKVTATLSQKEVVKSPSSITKSTYGSGIHFNPKFLQDHTAQPQNNSNLHSSLISKECNPTLSPTNSSRHRYISKYKIIRKKITPPIQCNPTNIVKGNVKKLNVTLGRKYKFKSNRDKSMSYSTKYTYVNKYSLKKYSSDKAHIINSNKRIKKHIVNSQKPVTKLKEIFGNESLILKINQKKSILQQKIEARRKGKSSFTIYGFRNYVLNSKYRYRTPELTKFCEISPKSHYNKHHYHRSDHHLKSDKKLNHTSICDKSVFKTISKMKLVRKSILQAQIESRRYAKKSLLQLQRIPKKIESQVSKYKIVRPFAASKKTSSSNKPLKKNQMSFSSNKYRIDKLKRLHILTKKLRKNNEPCPFYNRYGRCKGKEKGSCPKLHDPKYISICKKFLKGDCKEEGCTLSHDIRPEKMPTCYHYLAGLCKRNNCPFLHIKVNQKAPICRAFLQGFCADVYNCNKRHEFICPVFAEKGHCLKGKSCSLPHRNPKTHSKLLEPDQFPLLNKPRKNYHQPEVSKTEKHLAFKETVSEKKTSDKEVDLKQTEGKEFQRYFLATLSVESTDETVDKLSMDSKDDILHNKCE